MKWLLVVAVVLVGWFVYQHNPTILQDIRENTPIPFVSSEPLPPRPYWCVEPSEWKWATVPRYGDRVGACRDGDYIGYSGRYALEGCGFSANDRLIQLFSQQVPNVGSGSI